MKNNSCRHDYFAFILIIKLIHLLDKLNIENNEIYENIKNFSELCIKANKKDLYRGFFEFYANLDSDYLNTVISVVMSWVKNRYFCLNSFSRT